MAVAVRPEKETDLEFSVAVGAVWALEHEGDVGATTGLAFPVFFIYAKETGVALLART